MAKTAKSVDLLKQINTMPAIDIHTHLNASHLAARGLHDIMLYHMVISDLYSAGCPSGSRLSENPDEREITHRIEEAVPYLPLIANTSCFWLMRTILSDLYGWNEPITMKNWRKLHAIIQARSVKPAWPKEIVAKANVEKAGTEIVLRGNGGYDDILFYALEWSFFARVQWGVFDAPLFELEYAWQQTAPASPLPVTLKHRPAIKKQIKTVADIKKAMAHYCNTIPYDAIVSTAQHISTDINYQYVNDRQMQAALKNRAKAGPAERDVYASYLLEAFLTELEKAPKKIVFQFSLGAEPLPFETASRLGQNTIAQLAEIIARHPGLKFQCFLSSRHANQSLCTLCREVPNLSLAGYWWHNFFPAIIGQVIEERLDMLALNKQIGFFSDAYCVDWLYAKSKLVRSELAKVLSGHVQSGRFDTGTALEIARHLLYQTPKDILNLSL